ncbi:MAG: MFS transporter [Proteobacteria bacterium]|nr:MFS transporter [Pseudomonadota bacterium]
MNAKLSIREKVGFSLGDTAGNFVYQSVVLLLAYYYTDVYGLEAATVTAIFLFVRIFDAITDPLMGAIVDRTNSRWGKYRPFLLFLCVPYAVMSVVVFTVPDLDMEGKILYAYATYAGLMVLFTATNIPYFALGSVMTADPKERVSMNSYRFVAATGGGLVVTALLIPLADFLGKGDKALGYRLAMTVMAVLSVMLFLVCFGSTRERVKPANVGLRDIQSDLMQVFRNDQWVLLGLAVFVMVTAQTVKGTTGVYYLTYYADDAASLVPLFLSLWMIGGMLGSAFANRLTLLICKKRAWVMLCLISAVLSAATYLIAPSWIAVIMGMQFFVGFFNQMMAPLIFSTMAEVTDYGELKNKRRLDGLISSFTLFSLKVGLALGGGLATHLLAGYGYLSGGVDQSAETVSGILVVFTLVPAVGFVATAVILQRMKLSSDVVEENAARLRALRAEE